jgi:predicted secreted protein
MGGYMKKLIAGGFILLAAVFSSFAGDAAAFEDLGFSADGKTYIFAQYGKIDRTFQAWADIYTVNVAKNVFVPGEVYRILPSDATAAESGKAAYQKLAAKNYGKIKKYDCSPVSSDNILYIYEDSSKSAQDEIVFKDFKGSSIDNPVTYHIQILPTYVGHGEAVLSSFYITVKKVDGSGTDIASFKAGSPDIKRKGVSGYRIDKIFYNEKSKSLVFVVEKTLDTARGTSIRYMVETLQLEK